MAYIVRHPFTDFFNLTRATFDEGGKRLNERAGRVIARRIAVDVYADDDGYIAGVEAVWRPSSVWVAPGVAVADASAASRARTIPARCSGRRCM